MSFLHGYLVRIELFLIEAAQDTVSAFFPYGKPRTKNRFVRYLNYLIVRRGLALESRLSPDVLSSRDAREVAEVFRLLV